MSINFNENIPFIGSAQKPGYNDSPSWKQCSSISLRPTGRHALENLHKYSREGNSESLELLVKSNKDKILKYVDELNTEKMAALHYAARYNHLDCVRILVDLAGADVNVVNDEKATPMHFAARYRRKKQKTTSSDGDNADLFDAMSKDPRALMKKRILDEEMEPTLHNSVILYLASKGAFVNVQDCYGCTPMHYAAIRGNEVAASQLLMLCETDTEVEDNESMTPLHLACAHKQVEIASMLLKMKADLFNCEESGCIPFHIVCTEGSIELAELLINMAESKNELPKMLSAVDRDSCTPLHNAVEFGHLDIATLCLTKGADPNVVTHTGESPLHMASHYGSVELVKILISHGARLNVINVLHQTPMHFAAKKNHVSVINYLMEQGADIESNDVNSYTPFLMAASYGHSETVDLLMASNCDVFATEKENKSALYLAVEEMYPKAVMAILANENNLELLNIPDFNGNVPLHVASQIGRLDIVKILLEAGANEDDKNEEEQTPMHLAAKFGHGKVLRLLQSKFKQPLTAAEDENSNTPLHLAALNGYSKAVQLLLEMGADINARNCNKWTALDCAVAKGHFKVAQILLENDSPVDPMDKSKVTPLYLACKNGHVKLVRLLLQYNADVSVRVSGEYSDDGCNPLDAAIDNGYKECALAILRTNQWKKALRNQTRSSSFCIDTPMRKLIRKMPDVAEEVFNMCCTKHDTNFKNLGRGVTYNFEFLEDSYTSMDKNVAEKLTDVVVFDKTFTAQQSYDDNDTLYPSSRLYSQDRRIIKNNHPLMVMVRSERENLLAHPLVTHLLKIKWNYFGQSVYYANLLIYLLFIISLVLYMYFAVPPYQYYLRNETAYVGASNCLIVRNIFLNEKLHSVARISAYFVQVLAVVGAVKELIQLVIHKWQYFDLENTMEWIIYILAFVTVVNVSKCQSEIGIRDNWQWQTGSIAVFLGIINFVLFIRKVPFFGIFVLMFTDVMSTFLRFLPLFLLFIFAFAFFFYIVMSNQVAFFNLFNSMLRTTVMMIGEFDFDNVFNSHFEENAPSNRKLFYPGITYTIFVVFLLMMSIITMNLLVGLAVDDIKAVQEKATLQRLAMQVTLALEIEGLVPEFIRRRYVTRTLTVYPNRKRGFLSKLFHLENDQSSPSESTDKLELVVSQQKTHSDKLNELKKTMKQIHSQSESLSHMVSKLMVHLEIDVDNLNETETL